MNCTNVEIRLDAFRTGELSPRDAKAVQNHLTRCNRCAATQASIHTLATSLHDEARARSLRTLPRDSYDELADEGTAVWVAFSERGIRMVHRGAFADFAALHATRFGRVLQHAPLPEALRGQVMRALQGEGVRAPRVEFRDDLTPLERDILATLTRIPRGEVRTYEWVARQAGRPRAARAVGNVCASNVLPFVVPCHRVVPSAGGIGQYVFGSETKRALLRREGVDVDGLEALAKAHVRFIGSRTTGIACVPTCRDAKRIRPENRVPFRGAAKALAAGFRPCQHCQPFAA